MAKRRGKRSRYDQIIIAGIILSVIAIALYLWGPLHTSKRRDDQKQPPQTRGRELSPKQQAREKTESEKHVAKQHEKTAFVAIVIDDLGQDLTSTQEVLELPGRVTLAVMPLLPQSKKTAELGRRNGREVLLHLPMEPMNKNGKRVAPGTLRADMTPGEFITTLNDDIDAVPGAIGINNHEGSSLTENKEAMTFLMSELKDRNLFFLDSITGPKSAAYSTAKEFGLKAARRTVFLDNESDNPKYIRGQLEELTQLAKKNGSAIGIGHPHPATISELKKWLAAADERGIEIVPVSHLVR